MAKPRNHSRIVGTTTRPPSRTKTRQAPRLSGARRPSRRTLYLSAIGIALAVAAALVIISVATRGGGTSPSQPAAQAAALTGVAETQTMLRDLPQQKNVLGSPKAPVTLVEYADPQCPYCAEWARNALPEIVRDYVRPGKVRIEYRGMAFIGPESTTGLQAAFAAGNQGKFWHVLELLYANQGGENTGWIDEPLLGAIAGRAGIDTAQFNTDRGSFAVARAVTNSTTQARAAGVSSTPSFFAGRTGSRLRPVDVTSLDAGALRPVLDQLLAS